MSKIDKYIDELFHKKLAGAESTMPSIDGEWLKIQKHIRQQNFMRFSLNHFNVYYLSSAVALISTTTILAIKDRDTDKSIQIIESQSVTKIDSTYIIDPTAIDSSSAPLLNTKPEQPERNMRTNEIQRLEQHVPVNEHVKKSSMEPIINEPLPAENKVIKEEGFEKPQKDSIINEQPQKPISPADTIVRIDTIRVQKKKILFKRKRN